MFMNDPLLGPSRFRICARPTKIGPCQIVVHDPKKRGLPTKKYIVCIRTPMNSHCFLYSPSFRFANFPLQWNSAGMHGQRT